MTIKTITLAAAALLAAGSMAASATAQATGDADGAFITGSKFSEPDGEKMFRRVCAGCHMPDAKGVATGAGFYPALARNKNLSANGYPVYVLLKGKNGMPAVGAMMSDQQVADVVNYVRTNFGNRYKDTVTAADVKAVR